MADNSLKFRYHSNFRPDAAFQSVKFGYDIPILETELNEMQILQEEARKSIVRRLVPSGFIELIEKEFYGDSIIYNPTDRATEKLNHLALAPSRAMVNGTEVTLEGNFTIDGYTNYILVNLGEAPDSGTREDLVYLEVWFETITGSDVATKWGYLGGSSVGYPMVDDRVAEETTRRVAIRWDIKVAKGVNFSKYPEGFGYENVNNFSPIYGAANGQLGYDYNPNLIFVNAGDAMFKGCEFFKDNNLWIAGRPGYTFKSSSLFGNYIFALPMFRVKRRNKGAYSISNFNGSRTHVITNSEANSSIKGDLANHIRPDGLNYDYIVEQDLVDLRHTISVKEFSSEYYANKGLKQLFTGQLQTKDTKQMRRIQFGKKKVDYTTDTNAMAVVTFNDKSPEPVELPNISKPSYTTAGDALEWRDSIGGYGLFMNGKNWIKYSATGINVDSGTIDFFLQPYWNGNDNTINQTLLTLYDTNDNPIFKFEKKGSSLIWSQHSAVVSSSSVGGVNQVIVDLNNKMMFAKGIYHIRLSWANNIKINRSFVYINGNLSGDGIYGGSSLKPARLQIGAIEDIGNDNSGAVFEEMVIYGTSFENTASNGSYAYITNLFWPNLPEDFIHGSALLYPSFNSQIKNFEDNICLQKDTLAKLEVDELGTGEFTLVPPYGRYIVGTPKAYSLTGDYEEDGSISVLPGTWSNVDDTWYFTAEDMSLEFILVQYDLQLQPGNGGLDLPNEMLAAGLITGTDIQEISFSRKGMSDMRQVSYSNPNRVSAAKDAAYDLTVDREKDQCFARLLYYHKSGDGTNQYEIPAKLYGYDVIGIMGATNRKVTKITRVPGVSQSNGRYLLTLKDNVLLGDVLQIQLALGGLTFDYETHTKNVISDIHKVKFVEFVADGTTSTFVIPLSESLGNGGVLKSAFAFTQNLFEDPQNPKKVTGQVKKYACYVNNEMFPLLSERDANGDPTGKHTNQLAEFTIDESSFGTPFLKATFSWTPPQDTKLLFPVMTSYQPTDDEIISVWYNYIPYQGILSNKEKELKRISEWKYFITTLGSGSLSLKVDEKNIYSLNNIINRLPGGLSYAYTVDGKPVKLAHLASSYKADSNTQLVFPKDIILASENNDLDNSFFELDTDFLVSKSTKGFQDEFINMDGNGFKIYFPDCVDEISKYTGMSCLVMDEDGEILLFVLGCLNNGEIDGKKSKENCLKPIYGDLYKIPGLPTTVQQY